MYVDIYSMTSASALAHTVHVCACRHAFSYTIYIIKCRVFEISSCRHFFWNHLFIQSSTLCAIRGPQHKYSDSEFTFCSIKALKPRSLHSENTCGVTLLLFFLRMALLIFTIQYPVSMRATNVILRMAESQQMSKQIADCIWEIR